MNPRSLAILALLALGGCGEIVNAGVSATHDKKRGVTCWTNQNNGISCLPDSALKDQGHE